jgi:hypothetical protein
VKLAKWLVENKSVYRPGMVISYDLNGADFDILQLEVHQHTYGTDRDVVPTKKIEFEIMDVWFELSRA